MGIERHRTDRSRIGVDAKLLLQRLHSRHYYKAMCGIQSTNGIQLRANLLCIILFQMLEISIGIPRLMIHIVACEARITVL